MMPFFAVSILILILTDLVLTYHYSWRPMLEEIREYQEEVSEIKQEIEKLEALKSKRR